MRRLLAVLNHVETAPAVLAAAALAAQRLPGAAIEALNVRLADDPSFMPTEEIMTPARRAHFATAQAALSAALHQVFAAWPGAAGATWREESGLPPEVIARAGSTVDLIVIGRPAHFAPGDGAAAIDAALFAASAPVLLVPPAVPASLGRHIAIAWKPSDTAERAIVAATPLLRAAERVTVLLTEGRGRSVPEVLVQALGGGRAPATFGFALDGEPIGAALLGAAHAVGADLLLMGAYAHRRAVEMFLGGATRAMLAGGDLPVFMHH